MTFHAAVFGSYLCRFMIHRPRVVITYGSESVTTAELKGDTVGALPAAESRVRLLRMCHGAAAIVTVLDQMDKWSQILTADGYIGYVKNKPLERNVTTDDTGYRLRSHRIIQAFIMDGKVNLVWHQINYAEMNSEFASDTEAVTGVNVISPTWYFLAE